MRVLLIDDHALFSDALMLLIASRFPQLQLLQAGSLAEGLRQLQQHADVGLVLLDLGLPDAQGLQALLALRQQAPQLRLVVLSADDRHETVIGAIEAGACGFVHKSARAEVMSQALQVTLDGGVWLPSSGSMPAPTALRDHELGLSPRQLEVLRLLIEGLPNKLICRKLELSESTIKTHLAAIFRRLEVSNRTQAVMAAARLGLRLQT